MTEPGREGGPRTTAENAQLSLLLEVAGTPKPGNVDRDREYDDLRFEQFLAGAVGARRGLALAADPEGPGVGSAFERAVEGMSHQRGGNTQFGALLLVVPLARAAAQGDLSPPGAAAVVEDTTVADAAGFYRAFDHVDVSVEDPPEGMADLDVRRGREAVPAVRERGLTLEDVMERSADRDGVAREWVGRPAQEHVNAGALAASAPAPGAFPRSFHAADRLAELPGPLGARTSQVFLELLAAVPDTFVAANHDDETAREVSDRAAAALAGEDDPVAMGQEFVDRGINPGTTADLVAAGLFVALERGLAV